MNNYRYILNPYKTPASKETCPACGHKHVFTRYKDTQTGNLLFETVGRCDRENNCGYHKTPKQFFEENKSFVQPERNYSAPKTIPEPAIDYLDSDLTVKSMSGYENNNFVLYLKTLFGEDPAMGLVEKYCIGSSKHWKGATIFWQIDQTENIRQCKIMLYNPVTGKRVKAGERVEKWDRANKCHSPIVTDTPCSKVFGKYLTNETQKLNLQQCFFGEHLLTEHPDKTVAIVESEKTAIIASVYFPDLVWIATGGSSGCGWSKKEISKVLKGRNVMLYPDLGQFESWKQKAEIIKTLTGCNAAVSSLLEKVATEDERKSGFDLGDFLVRRDTTGLALTENDYPVMWDSNP